VTGPELRAARLALGLTQVALAERLGVPKDTLNRWEMGRQSIRFPTVLALAMEQLAREAGHAV